MGFGGVTGQPSHDLCSAERSRSVARAPAPAAQPTQAEQEPAAVAPQSASAVQCAHCGALLQPDARFCSSCGHATTTAAGDDDTEPEVLGGPAADASTDTGTEWCSAPALRASAFAAIDRVTVERWRRCTGLGSRWSLWRQAPCPVVACGPGVRCCPDRARLDQRERSRGRHAAWHQRARHLRVHRLLDRRSLASRSNLEQRYDRDDVAHDVRRWRLA